MALRTLHVALAALLLVTAGCLGTTTAAPAGVGNESTRTIDVAATGSASAAPDLAVTNVAVEARADSADAAREAVASNVSSMREALRDLGVPDDAVRTTAFFVGPEYDHRNGEREQVGYRAYHAFEIETDVDRAGEVVDAAVAGGATQVQGVRFTLTDETRSELRSEALTAAMGSARDDAETIAAAGGVSAGAVRSASTVDVGFPGPIPYAAEGAADGGGRTVLEPGPVEVTATVQVSYRVQ